MMGTYLDYAATTPVCDAAAHAALEAMQQHFGNPSSLYRLGLDAENLIAASRRRLAKALDCDEGCLYFTGSATEANILAVFGGPARNPRTG